MRPDLLRELGVLVRDGEFLSVENFVTEHAAELAPLLGTTARDLLQGPGHPDFLSRLGRRLDVVLQKRRQLRREAASDRAITAAVTLGRTARWFVPGGTRGVWVLDVELVLGDLLAGADKFVRFETPHNKVVIASDVLRRARILPRLFIDLVSFLDLDGLHFRWKAGRGALNLYPQKVEPTTALVVTLAMPALDAARAVGDGLSDALT